MAVLRRYNRYQGLKELDVLIDDDAPISQYFNIVEVPDIITQGRSSFLVGGSPLLKDGVELKFEIINDATGRGVVYSEAVSNYVEGTSRRVSIEVYDDPELFGDATLYVVGELDPTEVEVPAEWLDIYNVRWYTKVYISGAGVNTQPIHFYKQPSMWVGEIVKGFVETTYPTSSVTQSTGTVTGDPLPGTVGDVIDTKIDTMGDSLLTLRNSFDSMVYGGGGTNASIGKSGRTIQRGSPSEVQDFTITLTDDVADLRHTGATFTVNSPQVDTSQFTLESHHSLPDRFETNISKVDNSTTLVPQKPFTIIDTRFTEDDPRRNVIVPLAQTAYTMSFQPAPTHSVSTVNYRSFADVRISKMRTFSGDVHSVKLYARNKDAFGDFELIADTPIESPELLFDLYSSAGSKRMGYFENQDTINTYWSSGSNDVITHTSTIQLDVAYISGSNTAENSILRFESTGSRQVIFYKDIEYTVRAKILGKRGSKKRSADISAVQYGELGIFISGSAFESNHNLGNEFGYQLTPPGQNKPGFLIINEATNDPLLPPIDSIQNFGIVEEVFTPLRDGTGVIQFGATAGSWYVGDVSIRPNSDTGFSPDWIRIVAPVPPFSQQRPDDFEFIAEFYNPDQSAAGTVVHVSSSTFAGGNTVIGGTDNIITGSTFIGNALDSGVEMAGVDSAYIRSMGYLGFTSASNATGTNSGFMMWSGSVLPNSGDNYQGVGLELVGHSGSYLKFRTEPSELDIRANAFFVGNPTSQYISGSGGNIEISSSNFHVSSSGDVIMTGTVTADAGNIGDWIIKDGKLSGSNATLDATGAALYMSDKGPDTDSSATFDIQRDEYYIDFTPVDQGNTTNYFVKFGPNFAVDSSGVLVASGAVFEGQITASTGQIGGADIGDTSLEYSPYWRISSSADTTDPASFISSSRFKVSAGGNITGSQVLFTGGKIGGFNLGASSLQNIENTVELSSTLPGLSIKDAGGVARVQVKSGSLSTVGGGTQYIGNRSFEDDTISAGRNIRSGSNILSWSFAMGGHSSASLTDRSGYVDDDKAVSGDVTLDVVVPSGSGNYSSINTYELSQIITASISAGDTLSFSSVARFSSSFGGKGKDRALGPQYFRAEYSSSTGWIPFLPTANFTASNGYGEYFLGSGQYNSFGASAELPVAVEYVKLVLTGSINDDTGFSIKKPLYVGDKGTVDESLSGKTFTKNVVGSLTAEYPETEITFDNFSVRSNTRKVELSEEGILIYNSEDSFFKMDAAGIEYRGGSGVSNFGSSISRESFTNDSQVAGTLGAPSLQAYVGDPEAIGTTASDGNVGDYSKGNHVHTIAGSTINSVLSGITLTNGVWNSTFGATANTLISGSLGANASLIRSLTAVGISGSWRGELSSSAITFAGGGVSGSKSSTGSFGLLLQNGLPIEAATGTNTGDVTFAGSRDYITISGQEITRNVIDISDDTNLVAGVGINLNADTLDMDFTDSTLQSAVSGSWGGYITGSGILSGSLPALSGSWQGFISGSGIVSHSQFSSPSQGTVRATLNGVTTDVDTGLQTGDTPTFSNVIATNDIFAQGLYVSSSASTNVIQVGADGSGGIQKWEWHRDGTRRWLIYNEGRTNQAPIPQDSMVFKHGVITDGNDHINFHMEPDDQTVYFHGDISGSANLDIPGNAEFAEYIYHRGDTDTFIRFEGDKITFEAGGENMIYMVEGAGGLQADKVTINNDLADVDFQVKGDNKANLIRTDAANDRVGIGFHTFNSGNDLSSSLHIGGDLTLGSGSIPGHITASGNISSSGTVTAEHFYSSDDIVVGDTLTAEIGIINKGLTVNVDQDSAYDFEVKSQNKNHMLYVDTNKDKVGIGFNSPGGQHLSSSLHVVGDIFASGTGGHVTASGNISASGDISGSDIHAIGDIIGEDLYLGEYIYHKGGISGIDNDTYLRFRDNRVNLVAGGKSAIHYDSSAGKIVINNSNENVDFHVMAEDNSELLATDAENNRVGINTKVPTKALTVEGEVSSSGTIYVDTTWPQLQLTDDDYTDSMFIGMSGNTGYIKSSDTSNGMRIRRSDNFDIMRWYMNTETTQISGSGGLDVQSHISASGNISGSSTSTGSFGRLQLATGGGMDIPDEVRINFGDGKDLRIYHSGTQSIIQDTGTGDLQLKGSAIKIRGTNTGETIAHFTENAGIQLYYDNSKKLDVVTGGVDVTGDLTVTGDITAQEFHTEYVSASIVFSSGSTKFGDTQDDRHEFTGSLNLSGSLFTGEDNKFDIGSSTKEWKDLYIDGVAYVDTLNADALGANLDHANYNSTNVDIDSGDIGAVTISAGLTWNAAQDLNNQNLTNVDIDTGDIASGVTINKSPVITLGGDLGGNATLTNLASATLTATIQTDAVEDTMVNDNVATQFAGAGMTATSGVMNVIAGTGIDVAADEVAVDVSDFLSNGANNYVVTALTADTMNAESALQFDGSTLTINNTVAGSTTYTSGFAGGGWRIDEGITAAGKASATFDNLTIRGTMSVYELLIHQVRATNGSIWVSNTGKIESASFEGGSTYTLFFDSGSESGHGFMNADSIRSQRWSPTGDLYQSDLFVISTNNTGSLTATLSGSSDVPIAGYEYVRIGNISGSASSSRQGAIYLTSDDDNAPYIDVVDGVTHHGTFNSSGNIKARMGKLSGITSPTFGTLPGYGFYASGSAYLEGSINATEGLIAGWEVSASHLGKGNLRLSSSGETVIAGNGGIDSGTGTIRAIFGKYDGTNYGMRVWDGTNTYVKLSSDGDNQIANWKITPTTLYNTGSTGGLIMDASNKKYVVTTGSAADSEVVVMGQIASGPKFGIRGNDTSGNLLFKLGMDGNEIVGWDLTPGNIVSDNVDGSVRLSSTSQSLTIWTGSVNEAEPKVVLGKLPLHDGTDQTPYGFAVFSGSGTVSGSESSASVLITANKARLAGWELVPGALKSGTVASIDGNNASLALGTGATTATGTPTDGLFFVSASTSPVFYVGSNFSYVDDVLTAGGWKIGNKIISSSTSADTDGLILDAANKVLTFHGADGKDSFSPGSATVNNVRLAIGQIATGSFGLIGFDGSGNTLLELSEAQALIAGWTIDTSTISKNGLSLNSTAGAESLRIDKTSYSDTDEGIFIGNDSGDPRVNIGTANNYLKWTGTAVEISGSITATTGNIGGFYIDGYDIYGGHSAIGNSATTIVMGNLDGTSKIALGATADNLSMTVGTGFYADGGGNFKAGTANGYGIFWDTQALRVSSSEFYLGDSTNFISGSGGAINVEAQQFDLNTTYLRVSSSYGGTIAMGASIPKSISGSGVFLSGSGDFLAGNHTGNKIQFNKAASAIIMKSNTFSLDATTIVIDSAANDGKIALGASPNTSVAGTSAGVYMDGTGDFLAYGTGDNFIKKDGAALTIKSELFTLDAGELYITDAVSNGMIGMGSDGSAMSLTAGTGFYADGGGDFRVGKEKGVGISFDSSAGLLVMSSSAFLLGTSGSEQYTGAYISGSNGILSISSSNFFLAPAGDVTMQGTVTATAGAIGGWTLADGYIYGLTSGTPASSPSDGLVLKSGATAVITAYENTQKRVELGYLSSGIYGIKGYADNGTDTTFEMSDTQQMIAGWTFTNEQFSKSGGGGSVALKAGGTAFYGLDVADSETTTIVSVGSSSTPFSVLNTAELSKYTDTGRNFTDAQASVGDELNVTSYSSNKFAYSTPWKLEIEFGQHNDIGTHNNISSNGGFITHVGDTNNHWPPLGTPIGIDTGMTKQVKVVGSAGTGPTTATRAGGGVIKTGTSTDDIVIGGSTQYTSGSIVPGQAGDLNAIGGSALGQASLWNSNSSDGLPGHITYKFQDNEDNTYKLYADGVQIEAALSYSTTPRQIADGIYVSFHSAAGGTHTRNVWTVPIKCSGSLFYGSNDNSPDTTGRTLLFPSGTLAIDPTEANPKVASYTSQTRATVDIGIGGDGQFVEFEFYIKRKENPHYNEAVNSGEAWGVFAPLHTPYDFTVKLIERTGASTYNILSTKNISDIPTIWTKKSITGQINNSGLNGNDLLIEYTASVAPTSNMATRKNSHYVDEIRIASQSAFTSKPIVEMNQDGLLVYSSPSQQFKVDGSGLTLKSDEVTFKNVNVDQDINITEKLILTGSFENYATQSKFAGKTTFYNINHATSSTHVFSEFIESGSITLDSGSIDFKNRIRGGATGSTQQYIRQSYYGAYSHPEDTYLDDLTYGGGPSMIFGEEGVNAGFKLSSLQFTVPQRFGFGIRNTARVGTYSPDISEHREPKSIVHVRQAVYTPGIVSPMVALELSGSNATIHDNIIHFRTIRSIYGAGSHTTTPDRRQDWQIGIDGPDGMFKFSATDSASYDATDIDYPSTIGTGILNISSNANSSGTGRVGIATETPSYPLEVAGYNASNITIYAQRDIAAYSDVRSKADIETISGSLDIIGNIRGVTYKNKVSGSAIGSRMMGVIAQELEPYLPEIVSTDNKGFKSVKYGNLTALLIQAVKEQQEQIEELKQEIKEIKDAVSS